MSQSANRGRGGNKHRGGRGTSEDQSNREARQHKLTNRLTGTVRAVNSGDTFSILQNSSEGNTEFQFSLMGLKAPALGRRAQGNQNQAKSNDTKDEPWAWQSREFLREKIIGKVVVFRVEHTNDGGRRIGEAWLNDDTDLRQLIVKNGWANVPPRKDPSGNHKQVSKEDQVLISLLQDAKGMGLGMWKAVTDSAVRKIHYRDFSDQKEESSFFEKVKGQKKKAVVEQVRNGSTLRLYLPDSGDDIVVNLSGIRSPLMKTKDNTPEAYAEDAKFYTEYKLLNRTVTVILDTSDKFNFFGTVLDLEGNNIAFGLLEFGLASVVDWHIPSNAAKEVFQNAENVAKNANLRIWGQKNNNNKKPQQQQQQQQQQAGKTVSGRVVEVNSLGTITVRVQDNNTTEQKFHFSSIRVPRLAPREVPKDVKGKKNNKNNQEETEEQKKENEQKEKERQQQELIKEKLHQVELQRSLNEMTPEAKAEYQKREQEAKKRAELEKEQYAYAFAGKDFLRKKLIGKTVKCVFDYKENADNANNKNKNNKQQLPPKNYYSIYEGKTNVALDLVRQGYANVVNHMDNQPRSAEYRELLVAEREAQKNGAGIHATKNRATLPLINDLSNATDSKKTASFLDLIKKGRQQGVVEMVWSTKKFKLYLPNHGAQIAFALAGTDMPLHIDDKMPPNPPKGEIFTQYPLKNQDGSANIFNEAFHYSRDNLLQRDVEIEVIETAKVGNTFLGRLFVKDYNNNNKSKDDFTSELLKKGYLRLNTYASKKVFSEAQFNQLSSLETAAKNEKRGFWSIFNEKRERDIIEKAQNARNSERAELQANTSTDRRIVVTEILSGSYFFYQVATPKSKQEIEDLMKEFGAVNFSEKPAFVPVMPVHTANSPQPLLRVAGNFSVDNTWYRAEVLEITGTAEQPLYKLRYIDYGNTETVTGDRIRALPQEFQKTPAQAKKAKLAYISAPDTDSEFGQEAAEFFKSLCWGKDLLANVQFCTPVKEKGSKFETELHHITLGDEETKIFINAAMVMHGLACVDSKKKLPTRGVKWPMWNILKEEEEIAKKDRLNIWQYGEYGSDDENQFTKKGKK